MPEITDKMIDAGAAILDPMLSSNCPRQVARDVYAAMEEARRGVKPMGLADWIREQDPARRSGDAVPTVEGEVERYQSRALRSFAFAESQVYEVPVDRIGRVIDKTTATSDGRW